jgi:hypothetical protein
MSRKPETTFIASIHKKLPEPAPYHEKQNNPFSSGTPDVYYSGTLGDLWVEYKFIERLPSRPTTLVVPDLSAGQKRWLGNRLDEGRNVAVILGVGPKDGILYQNREWLVPLPAELLRAKLILRQDLANWIKATVGENRCQSLE